MPHITEEIWHTLTNLVTSFHIGVAILSRSGYNLIDLDLEQQFEVLVALSALFAISGQRRILNRGEGDGDFAK